jgi:homoserine trans-succinylase
MNINSLTVDEIINKLGYAVYELFDFYVLSEDKLFCIDVKNWSSFNKEELSLETHKKALRKAETVVSEVTSKKNIKAVFIYVNTHQDKNAINSEQEFDDNGKIHYMNLFKVITQYETVNSEKPNPKRKSSLKERLNINSSLIQLLGGTLNG